MYHYKECGLRNIYLLNGYSTYSDPEFGECISIANIEGLHKAIGLELLHYKPRLTGAEFRYLRHELGLSQSALARFFGNDEQAIARWEKTGKVPKWADHFIRLLVKDMYKEDVGVMALIESVQDLDTMEPETVVFGESDQVWFRKAA